MAKVIYTGKNSIGVWVGDPEVFCAHGVETEVPDELAKALVGQPFEVVKARRSTSEAKE